MQLEPNPMILRQHDSRKLGAMQVLDDDGVPVSLSTDKRIRWKSYDRPGGVQLFEVGSATASASGGSLVLSTLKESGHFYHSMTSQAISNATPGPFPTEIELSTATGRRTYPGNMLIVQERLA